jgi:FkbM family methyltransferase
MTYTFHTRQGIYTVFCADAGIGKPLYCAREYERDLTHRATAFLRSMGKMRSDTSGTLLDIGANIGIISIGMLRDQLLQRAIAIEPEPRNFELLTRNVRQNGLGQQIVCLPYALSSRPGLLPLEVNETNLGDHHIRPSWPQVSEVRQTAERAQSTVIQVESVRLDDLLENLPKALVESLDLVWIDVQGYEANIFIGGQKLFSRDVSVVAEFWPSGISRVGMSQEEYCRIASDLWSAFWIFRHGKFVRNPIGNLRLLFEQLAPSQDFENVVFTRCP